MQSTPDYPRVSVPGPLVVANILSLLCVFAFAIYLWTAKEPLELILYVIAAPSILHVIALVLLLLRPGATVVSASMVISSLGLLVSGLFVPITLLDWAMSNAPITPLLNLAYLCLQLWVLFQGVKWKKLRMDLR